MEYSCNRSYHWIIIPPDRLFHHILNYLQITMKRISFNDKYGLTKAVLEGRKTQERRIITCPSFYKEIEVRGFYVYKNMQGKAVDVSLYDEDEEVIAPSPRYEIGEILAIAQSYKDLGYKPNDFLYLSESKGCGLSAIEARKLKGWNYKQCILSDFDYLLSKIQITNIRIEHLQDISEEDCMAEGIRKIESNKISKAFGFDNSFEIPNQFPVFDSPREAYSFLTEQVFGKGTWESNPWVWVYDFEIYKKTI